VTLTDWLWLGVAFAGGLLLGGFYFGALWWTVQRITTARSPGLLTLASYLGRTVITLLGFFLISGGQWQRLVACLAGFVAARFALVLRWRPRPLLPGQPPRAPSMATDEPGPGEAGPSGPGH
jgi:F1F0 ATPase subunit 2